MNSKEKKKRSVNLYQVDEGQEFPAASVGLVSWHVQGFVVTQDGEIRQEDGDPENLRGDERHDAPCSFGPWCVRLRCCWRALTGRRFRVMMTQLGRGGGA